MRVIFTAISIAWAAICIAKLFLVLEDARAFEAQHLEVFVNANLGSLCIALASLILIISYYMDIIPSIGVCASTVVTTLMSLGYFATWLSFGVDLTLIAMEGSVDLSQTQGRLLPYALLDCLLVCTQLAMIAREAILFMETERMGLAYMEQGHPLSTLVNSIIFLAIVTSIVQISKVVLIGLHWPLSNDATSVFAIISAMSTLCCMIVCTSYNADMRFDRVQGTTAIVVFSLAILLVWGSAGSSLLMMSIKHGESYQLLFSLDAITGVAQLLTLALLQYLAINLHVVLSASNRL